MSKILTRNLYVKTINKTSLQKIIKKSLYIKILIVNNRNLDELHQRRINET